MGSYYLEGDLGQEDEFVCLEESPCGVRVDRVGDLVRQVDHPLLDVVAGGRVLDGFLKHRAERLRGAGGSSAPAAGGSASSIGAQQQIPALPRPVLPTQTSSLLAPVTLSENW